MSKDLPFSIIPNLLQYQHKPNTAEKRVVPDAMFQKMCIFAVVNHKKESKDGKTN